MCLFERLFTSTLLTFLENYSGRFKVTSMLDPTASLVPGPSQWRLQRRVVDSHPEIKGVRTGVVKDSTNIRGVEVSKNLLSDSLRVYPRQIGKGTLLFTFDKISVLISPPPISPAPINPLNKLHVATSFVSKSSVQGECFCFVSGLRVRSRGRRLIVSRERYALNFRVTRRG